VERVASVSRDVDAHLVEESNRPHRHPEVDGPAIDLVNGDALRQQVARFVQVRAEDAVHEESRAVPTYDRDLPETECECVRRRDGFVGRRRPPHDLDERHPVHRIEEVESAETLGALQPQRHLLHGERRRVGRDHRVVAHDSFDLAEDLPLHLHPLHYRLDQQVGVRDEVEIESADDQLHLPVRRGRSHPTALHPSLEEGSGMGEPSGHRLVPDVAHADLEAPRRCELRDPASHHSGAEHAESLHRLWGRIDAGESLRTFSQMEEVQEVAVDRGGRQLAEGVRFTDEGGAGRTREGRLEHVENPEWGGVVPPGLLHHLAARGAQHEASAQRVPLEQLLSERRLPPRRPGGDLHRLARKPMCRRTEPFWGVRASQESDAARLRGRDLPPGQDQVESGLEPHEPRQSCRTSPTRQQP